MAYNIFLKDHIETAFALQGLGQWFETFINCLQNFRKLITFTRKINEQLMLWPM